MGDKYEFDVTEARKIWCFGPETTGPRESSISMKSRILALLASSGPLKRVFSVTKTCAVFASIFTTLLCTLTRSTVAEVKLSPPPDVFSTPPCSQQNQGFVSLSTAVRFSVLKTLLEESTVC